MLTADATHHLQNTGILIMLSTQCTMTFGEGLWHFSYDGSHTREIQVVLRSPTPINKR